MSSRVFVSRVSGLTVLDPLGDRVGVVRDVVVSFTASQPRAIGLVIEVPGKKRVFLPMTRVTSIDPGAVISTGLVNMRRFEQRATETLAVAEIFDRSVDVRTADEHYTGVVEDIAIKQNTRRDWILTKVFVRQKGAPLSTTERAVSRLRRRRPGSTALVDVTEVTGLRTQSRAQSAERLLETYEDLRTADFAEVIHDLTPKRRAEVAAALDDDRLADVLEELPEEDQVEILAGLANERAADVLEAMEPDDAADLLADLPPEQAERLLQLMEPDDAEPLRRLMEYDERTAGGLMTTEPVILGPDDSVAEALAMIRKEELDPALASAVFVCRPPLETPTGRFIGLVHAQKLLREPPHTYVGMAVDKTIEAISDQAPLEEITRTLATYNLVVLPVVDEDGHLLGAVSVDDVLDHILPQDWREERHEVRVATQPIEVRHGGAR